MNQEEETGVFRAIIALGCIGLAMWMVVIALVWGWLSS